MKRYLMTLVLSGALAGATATLALSARAAGMDKPMDQNMMHESSGMGHDKMGKPASDCPPDEKMGSMKDEMNGAMKGASEHHAMAKSCDDTMMAPAHGNKAMPMSPPN